MFQLSKFHFNTPVVQVPVAGTVSPGRFAEMQIPRMVLALPESEGRLQAVPQVTRMQVRSV